MKNILFLALVVIFASACEKDPTQHNVKFQVEGTSITEMKLNYRGTLEDYKGRFDSTSMDTTVFVSTGTPVSLEAKAIGGQLNGKIYVDHILVAEQDGLDTDNDGNSQVKVDFTVK